MIYQNSLQVHVEHETADDKIARFKKAGLTFDDVVRILHESAEAFCDDSDVIEDLKQQLYICEEEKNERGIDDFIDTVCELYPDDEDNTRRLAVQCGL